MPTPLGYFPNRSVERIAMPQAEGCHRSFVHDYARRSPEQAPRDAHYWAQNMSKLVLLNTTIKSAAEDGFRIFLEVSTHPVISHSVGETLMDLRIEDHASVPTLLRNKPARRAFLKSLATIRCRGVSVDWKVLFPGVS
jgi:6-methylsalicylic acid synthase